MSVPTPAGHRPGGQIEGDAGSRIGIDGAVEALAAVDGVVAGKALEPVVAAEALEGVVAGGAGERVGAGGADDEGAAVDGDAKRLVEGQAAGVGGAHGHAAARRADERARPRRGCRR